MSETSTAAMERSGTPGQAGKPEAAPAARRADPEENGNKRRGVFPLMRWRRLIFGINPREVTFGRRGFHGGVIEVQRRLEQVGRVFLSGYHAALEDDTPAGLGHVLEGMETEWRGFAFEGAAMGLTLLDTLLPGRRNRFRRFLAGPGAVHTYMMHVGAGWAAARVPGSLNRMLSRLDPLLRWLALDGHGFHAGYFHWRRHIRKQDVPRRLSGYQRRAFDQGLGRSLWFVDGADVARVAATIETFSDQRQPDLWSGIGLACAYAGGVDRAGLESLRVSAGPCLAHLAQGAAFAAQARRRALNPAAHTDLACEVMCGVPADTVAVITVEALKNLPADGAEPAFEIWRQRIQAALAPSGGAT